MTEPTLVVVGAGHVAASTARALRRRGFAGPVVLLGDEPVAPYDRPHLSKERLASGGDAGLWLLDPVWCAANDVTLRTGSPVDLIDTGTGEVVLEDGGQPPRDRRADRDPPAGAGDQRDAIGARLRIDVHAGDPRDGEVCGLVAFRAG